MTNLRPGLGSCTPNWGTHDDRDLRDFLVGQRPSSSRCGTCRTPLGWIGPQAGDRRTYDRTRRSPSALAATSIAATMERLLRPDDRVKTN